MTTCKLCNAMILFFLCIFPVKGNGDVDKLFSFGFKEKKADDGQKD